MFAADVPTHRIDLEASEPERWAGVIAEEGPVATRLIQEAAGEFERVPELVRRLFARLYQVTGGLYLGEIRSWSEALGISIGTVTMLNCAYELSHLHWPKLFGCTAGARWIDGFGMVHVRNLDWPLESMGDATRLFRFHRGGRKFVSVGVPGQVGVLSGMVPRGYSATINWAPPAAFPSFEFGPTFLLRDVLESCDTYADAVRRLTRTRLSTSVFFTVCGIERNEACVIERTPREAVVRSLTGAAVVQANHHVADEFVAGNEELLEVVEGEEEFSLEGSTQRADALAAALAGLCAPQTLDEAASVLDVAGVKNKLTCQQMAFCPATGEVRVWRQRLKGSRVTP